MLHCFDGDMCLIWEGSNNLLPFSFFGCGVWGGGGGGESAVSDAERLITGNCSIRYCDRLMKSNFSDLTCL